MSRLLRFVHLSGIHFGQDVGSVHVHTRPFRRFVTHSMVRLRGWADPVPIGRY